MDRSSGDGGEVAAKRPNLSPSGTDAGEDRLSALPDEMLVLILLCLDTTAAGRTSVLSRRWRRVWTLLPELRFSFSTAPHLISAALEAHEASLHHLLLETLRCAAEPMADCLRVAARRLTGQHIVENERSHSAVNVDFFDLPCFESAITVSLDLGFLRIVVPPDGVCARLTELTLMNVWFHRPADLGDAVSSPRSPKLQKLKIQFTIGLVSLAVHPKSLLAVDLKNMFGLRQLTIDASALKQLTLFSCFQLNKPVADISTPQLELLHWNDSYDPSSVQLGEIAQPQCLTLGSSWFCVYGPHDFRRNLSCLRLLEQFQTIHKLRLPLGYPQNIGNFQFLMGDINTFPHLEDLTIILQNAGHAFGASMFHILRMCTNITRFSLVLSHTDLEGQCACQSGCICDETTDWKAEELNLDHLHAVQIVNMVGTDHEIAFLKRLFSWAKALKIVQLVCTPITASMVEEVHEKLLSLAMPETSATLELQEDV